MSPKTNRNDCFIILAISIMIITSCQKSEETDAMSDAILTGYDIRDCVCCGGLMVTFSNNPAPYSETFYLVNVLPDGSGIDATTKFPLFVRITWKYSTHLSGNNKFVDILKLEKK